MSIDTVNGIAQLSVDMAQQRLAQDVGITMLKKGNDLMEQQGKQVLELINSVPKPEGSKGHNIDVKV